MQHMRLVDEKDGKYPLASQLFDMAGDGEEDITCGRSVGDTEGMAEMAIEVAPPEGHVVAVGEADGLALQGVAGGARHTGLARAGLTGDDGVLAFLDALDEIREHYLNPPSPKWLDSPVAEAGFAAPESE